MSSLVNKTKFFFQEYKTPLVLFLVSKFIIIMTFVLVGLYGFGSEPHFNQWDAPHYISIAANGYQNTGVYLEEGSLIAFFPLFPITIWIVETLTHVGFTYAGIVVSYICSLASFLLLYRMVADWKGKDAAAVAVSLLAFYPSAVFLSSSYTEGLFMLLVLSTFYFLSKNKIHSAVVTVALACVTRITASVLGIVFAIEVWIKTKSVLKTLGFGILACLPFAAFLYFQYIHFGTPSAFLIAQEERWTHHAVWPWIGFWNLLQYVINDTDYAAMWRTDFFFLILMMTTLVLSFKKVPRAIWLFGAGVIVLTLSSSFILSISRYMIMVIPFYYYWGEVLSRKKLAFQTVLAVSAGWMVLNTILFVLSKYVL